MSDPSPTILDQSAECASPGDREAAAEQAWESQRTVVSRSAFYRAKLAGTAIGRLDLGDLQGLPFTSKQELQESQDEAPPYGAHLAAEEQAIARRYQTSGTSGKPMVIALTRADVATWMAIGRRGYHAMGVEPETTVLSTFGAQPYVVGFTHEVIESLGATVTAPGLRNTAGAIEAMSGGATPVLLSTPSTAAHLIDRLSAAGIDPAAAALERLILGGEPGAGPGPLRARLERAFEATVIEAMGIGDIAPSLFAECPAGTGMHFMGDGLVWPEIVDADGRPLPFEAGVTGELVYTHLRREAMPLVRFLSGDHVRVVSIDCPCGRTSFAIRVDGRNDDMFVVRGVNVYPSAVQAVVTATAEEATGRIRLARPAVAAPAWTHAPPLVIVELSPGVAPTDDLAARIATAIHEQLRFRTEVRLEPARRFGDAHYKSGYREPGA
jgi:phenylacetate-CoA ligase